MINQAPNLHEEEDGGDEIWLISYSDLMTLLFGFFVLMYSFASVNNAIETEKVKKSMARAFGGSFVPQYENLLKELEKNKMAIPEMKEIQVEQTKEGVEIVFQSGLLFKSGEATILPDVHPALKSVINIIFRNIQNSEIVVAGHTDDAPINTITFPSNWELSAARASSVIREFIKYGFDPKKLSAVGFADSRPAYPNYNDLGQVVEENRKRNRRVVLKVVAPGNLSSKVTEP